MMMLLLSFFFLPVFLYQALIDNPTGGLFTWLLQVFFCLACVPLVRWVCLGRCRLPVRPSWRTAKHRLAACRKPLATSDARHCCKLCRTGKHSSDPIKETISLFFAQADGLSEGNLGDASMNPLRSGSKERSMRLLGQQGAGSNLTASIPSASSCKAPVFCMTAQNCHQKLV